MKKLLLILLGLQSMAFAQTISNGGFEKWTNTNTSVIRDWNVSGNEGFSRISDPFRGNYAGLEKSYFQQPLTNILKLL
ncbi:MAG: hypothetical protein SGJ00_11495 [bacterium]|nr:hypothetical protein [bacterium]